MERISMTCPCKGCEDRVAATKVSPYSCHATCIRYIAWRGEKVNEREELKKHHGVEALAVIVKSLNHVRKKHHRSGK